MLEHILENVPILPMPTELMNVGLANKNPLFAYASKGIYGICAGIFPFSDESKGRYIVLNTDCHDLPRRLMHEVVMYQYGHLMQDHLGGTETITVEDSGSWEMSGIYWQDDKLRNMVTQKVIDLLHKYDL